MKSNFSFYVACASLCLVRVMSASVQFDPHSERFVKNVEKELAQGRHLPANIMKGYTDIKHMLEVLNQNESSRAVQEASELQTTRRIRIDTSKKQIDCPCIIAELKKIEKALTCDAVIPIFQKDINCDGLVIDKPGCYCLAEDIVFNPKQSVDAAITICSDCVKLDLNGKKLSLSSKAFNRFDDVSGIIVKPGKNSIIIQNGKITNFSNQGIWVRSDSLEPDDHHGIVIDTITVKDCGKSTTSDQSRFENQRSGIGVDGATNVVIKNSIVKGTKSRLSTSAISAVSCVNVIVDSCTAQNNTAARDFASQALVAGIELDFCDSVSLTNCVALNNDAWNVFALFIFVTNNFVVSNCQGNNNTSVRFADGIHISDAFNGQISDCLTNNNSADSDVVEEPRAAGVGMQIIFSSGIVVTDCIANGNNNRITVGQGVRPMNGGGFNCVVFATDIVMQNCVAYNNFTSDDSTGGTTQGFLLSAFVDNVVLKNCVATSHNINNPNVICGGFLIGAQALGAPTAVSNVVLDSCVAENNHNNAVGSSGFGIRLGNFALNSCVLNSQSKANDIGIQLDGINTVNNVVENNHATGNLFFGVQDITGNLTNAYSSNVSYNPSGTNYNSTQLAMALPTGNPILLWNKTGGMLPVVTPAGNLDNVDIR